MKSSGQRRLTILGATGSIGVSTLDVVARHPGRFGVFALSGHTRIDLLAALCRAHRPRYVVVPTSAAAQQLAGLLKDAGGSTEVLSGARALVDIATASEVDTVMAAIVGAAGLPPTLAAAVAGKRVLLANKEALVMAGALFKQAIARSGALLLPIDSEHNAVFQSLPAHYAAGDAAQQGVRRILLTASGGPFRDAERWPAQRLEKVTPEEACAHPNWSMGRKISVDSATMMNKGLEVIEAHWLFGLTADAIEVVIHPQSIVHSLVDYVDGSVLAQLGNPDMRTPIAHALAWPQRIDSGVARLDLATIGKLEFFPPDFTRFPCLKLAYQALAAGGAAPTVLNAANETAVAAFLAGELPFTRISAVIDETLAHVPQGDAATLDAVIEADRAARLAASRSIK